MKKWCLLLYSCCIASAISAQEVMIAGQELTTIHDALCNAGYTVRYGDHTTIDAAQLVVVDGRKPVEPMMRQELAALLQRNGNLLILGTEAFNYTPKPYDSESVVDLTDPTTYIIERDKRDKKAGSLETPKPAPTETHRGKPAIELRTLHRSMPDMFLKIDISKRLDNTQNVLTFSACGNAYVDLLALEIIDRNGNRWLSFCSLSNEWADYAVSLADFIPEGNTANQYELLQPSEVSRLFMGVNLLTIWHERPTYLALGDIGFARNHNPIYAPTSELMRMQIPFETMNTKVPETLFDPAFRAEKGASGTIIRNSVDWVTGVRMGDDTEQGYKTKFTRESRIYPLIERAGAGNEAQIEFFANGPLAGGAVALFANEMEEKLLTKEVVRAADLMTRTPMVVSADMHTSRPTEEDQNIYPSLELALRNPLKNNAKAKLSIIIDNRTEHEDTSLVLPSEKLTMRKVKLHAVREGFPSLRFDWSILLTSGDRKDELCDRVDVERAMLVAFRHLVRNQMLFPDGRISNHYFGDAYGVRAMLAFLHHTKHDQSILERHPDIFSTVTLNDMRFCAHRFFDMLCDRQAADGSMPMGYSEPGGTCNVADMGQISLAMAQSSQYVDDPERKERYLNAARRLAKWAETYYIDAEKSQRLKAENPKMGARGWADEGQYGLGASGKRRRETGPTWVLSDILGIQTYLAFYDTPEMQQWARPIYDRNARFYIGLNHTAEGYFQAEALFWLRKTLNDPTLIAKIDANLKETMLGKRYRTIDREPYKLGSRGSLNALPLLYYQRYIGDDANIRAVLLKYFWAFAAQGSFRNMERQTQAFPKPTHGEGMAASKFASFSALWAVEALYPESTFSPITPNN